MSLPGSTVLVTSADSGLEDRWLYGDWPLAALPSGWWCSASGQALPGCPCPGGARPPPSVAPWPVRAKPQLPSGRSSHQRILFHIRARQSEPWGRCCCLLPAGAAPPRGVPSLWSPLHWGPSLGCSWLPGVGQGGLRLHTPCSAQGGLRGQRPRWPRKGPVRARGRPRAPGSVPPRWPGHVSPTGLGAQGAAHLSCGVALDPRPRGALTAPELSHRVPCPFLFPVSLRGELCLTPASKNSFNAFFSERANNSLTSFRPMVFFVFHHLGLLGLKQRDLFQESGLYQIIHRAALMSFLTLNHLTEQGRTDWAQCHQRAAGWLGYCAHLTAKLAPTPPRPSCLPSTAADRSRSLSLISSDLLPGSVP